MPITKILPSIRRLGNADSHRYAMVVAPHPQFLIATISNMPIVFFQQPCPVVRHQSEDQSDR